MFWPRHALAGHRDRLGETSVALVDRTVLDLGIADDIIAELADHAVVVESGEPQLAGVQAITDVIRIEGATGVVAIGGGSAIDTAKIAAAAARSEREVADHLMSRHRLPEALPLVAVPTTAGSGAEVTKMAVVSDGPRKSWVWDEALRPLAAILDPAVTVGLPEPVTVASGCDAFVHAVESSSARIQHEHAAAAGTWAAGEVFAALPAVLEDPEDLERRRRMQIGACAAGVGIDRCGTGIGHAIGHAVASLLTAPHGLLVMLGSLVAIEWGVASAPERYAAAIRSIEPSAEPSDLPELLRRFAETVGYERHLAPHAAAQTLGAEALAAELPRDVHKPMWSNNAAVPDEADLTRLAHETAREWERIGNA